MFVYNNEEAKKGLEKYRTFTQGKIHDISVAALGSMLESLKIDEANEIKVTFLFISVYISTQIVK
jgi:hypothetical protein